VDYKPLSRQILDISLKVQAGDRIWINGWEHTSKLVSHLSQECRKRGCEVVHTLQSEVSWLRSLRAGPSSNLEKLTSKQRALLDEIDAYIFTLGPRHPIDWKKIPLEKRRLATIWLSEDNKFVKEWKSKAARRKIKMLGIEATLATEERAKALRMDFRTYAESMYAGCLADSHHMASQAKRLSSVFRKRAFVRIATPSGTDLQFNLDNRPTEISHGLVTEEETRNAKVVFLPAGAVGTTVDEESANGLIVYDSPIRRWNGIMNGLKLRISGGRVAEYSASDGASVFKEYLENSGGDADRFAFFGFGLNPMLKLGYTQDDKVLGSIELNFGENESRGGKNKGRGDFWGVVSKANVTVNGLAIMESGRLLI